MGGNKALTSIIDNQGENTLHHALNQITTNGTEFWIATAFFSLDAMNMMGDRLGQFERVRLLFGGDAAPTQRRKLLEMMRTRSDADLLKQREQDPLLKGLEFAKKLIEEGRLEARVYTKDKFHAKAYLAHCTGHPPLNGILGSGNFTRPGLTQNIELNVHLTIDQTQQLEAWFEEAWAIAEKDTITVELLDEIRRQLDLYDPYAIYQKALLAWGQHYQGKITDPKSLKVASELDPHQLLGYTRALEILDRENGVMVCDGVGLGKSYIALALMEYFCQQKKNVLLIAPKSIMEASWRDYLSRYLSDFRQPYGTIFEKTMSDLGFKPDDEDNDTIKYRDKVDELQKLAERVDVIVIDESHNFRTTNTQRYNNLKRIGQALSADPDKQKKVILLTATPINTSYQDLSAQLALVAHETGNVSGYTAPKINTAAKQLDKEAKEKTNKSSQPVLDMAVAEHDATLRTVLESIVIQRKRTTCIELAQSVGKQLVFPKREKPITPTYELSEHWKKVVEMAHSRFHPIAVALKKAKEDYQKAEAMGVTLKPFHLPARSSGIRFAAFLPQQYTKAGTIGKRNYQIEVFLAGLVFTNTMKQLESSPAAFQGILQSLGTSLIARLKFVFNDEAKPWIEPHLEWVRTEINKLEYELDDEEESSDDEAVIADGESADQNGKEGEWLQQAISSRHLHHKLGDFQEPSYDVERWKKDILHDLDHLREIHRETIEARRNTDFKLEVVAKILGERIALGQRVVVFTQTQRTSFYLEKQLQEKFKAAHISRIDSNVKQETRADILYAFCPNYNPKPRDQRRERVDVLICTDVLSEGVNMQESECILNYDIHWNPVRLIQRIGRVDRRLDPVKTPEPHSFSIINFLPPKEINDIIRLVDTVENRTTQISKTLGIDQAFFKSTDPEGTLREFNAMVDGEPTLLDKANAKYVKALASPDPELQAIVEQMPLGAFGVWTGAPTDGVFALFEMKGTENLTKQDVEKFKGVLNLPILILKTDLGYSTDGGKILDILGQTVKGEKSGDPGDATKLAAELRTMKNKINQSFREINLVGSIQPKLVCWMELRGPNA